jgi:hypothetical protein
MAETDLEPPRVSKILDASCSDLGSNGHPVYSFAMQKPLPGMGNGSPGAMIFEAAGCEKA